MAQSGMCIKTFYGTYPMPRVTVKVHGTYESITRPVAMGVAKDVMAIMGVDTRETATTLLGEFGVKEQPGAKMGESGDVSFGSNSKVIVTLEDNVRYENILSTHVRSKEHPPIYADKRLGIGVYPVYLDSELTITFSYTAANKEEALKWRDDYMIKKAEELSVLYHEINYHIPMQDGIFELLHHLWELREKISGYGDTFDEYLRSIQEREITTLTRVDGDMRTASIAVHEKQIQVTGWFDFTEPPKPEKEDGGTRWVAEWSYKCLYKRCSHFYIVYPMVVHQQHISNRYFAKKRYFSYEEMPRNSGIRIIADEMIKGRQTAVGIDRADGLRYPTWDDWIPRPTTDGAGIRYRPLFTWLIGLKPDNATRIMDLKATPEFRWSLPVENYMRNNHLDLTKRRKSIIYIRLYKGDVPVDDTAIYVDDDLVLHSHNPLDLRYMYHVRFTVALSPVMLDSSAIDKMRHDPEFTYEVLKSIDNNLDDGCFLEALVSDKVIRRGYIEQTLQEIEGKSPTGEFISANPYEKCKDNQGVWSKNSGPKTVQSLLIVAKRKEGN